MDLADTLMHSPIVPVDSSTRLQLLLAVMRVLRVNTESLAAHTLPDAPPPSPPSARGSSGVVQQVSWETASKYMVGGQGHAGSISSNLPPSACRYLLGSGQLQQPTPRPPLPQRLQSFLEHTFTESANAKLPIHVHSPPQSGGLFAPPGYAEGVQLVRQQACQAWTAGFPLFYPRFSQQKQFLLQALALVPGIPPEGLLAQLPASMSAPVSPAERELRVQLLGAVLDRLLADWEHLSHFVHQIGFQPSPVGSYPNPPPPLLEDELDPGTNAHDFLSDMRTPASSPASGAGRNPVNFLLDTKAGHTPTTSSGHVNAAFVSQSQSLAFIHTLVAFSAHVTRRALQRHEQARRQSLGKGYEAETVIQGGGAVEMRLARLCGTLAAVWQDHLVSMASIAAFGAIDAPPTNAFIAEDQPDLPPTEEDEDLDEDSANNIDASIANLMDDFPAISDSSDEETTGNKHSSRSTDSDKTHPHGHHKRASKDKETDREKEGSLPKPVSRTVGINENNESAEPASPTRDSRLPGWDRTASGRRSLSAPVARSARGAPASSDLAPGRGILSSGRPSGLLDGAKPKLRSVTPGRSTSGKVAAPLPRVPFAASPAALPPFRVLREHIVLLVPRALELLSSCCETLEGAQQAGGSQPPAEVISTVWEASSSSIVCKALFPLCVSMVKLAACCSNDSKGGPSGAYQLLDPLAVPAFDFTPAIQPYLSPLLRELSRFNRLMQLRCPAARPVVVTHKLESGVTARANLPRAQFAVARLSVKGKVDPGVAICLLSPAPDQKVIHKWEVGSINDALRPLAVVRATPSAAPSSQSNSEQNGVTYRVDLPKYRMVGGNDRLATIRLTFTPVAPVPWPVELERVVAWLCGRLSATLLLHRTPARDAAAAAAISPPLFLHGLPDEHALGPTAAAPGIDESETIGQGQVQTEEQEQRDSRIQSVVDLQSADVLYSGDVLVHDWLVQFQNNTGLPALLIDCIQETLRRDPILGGPQALSNEYVLRAERCTVSAVLKHAGLLRRAMHVADELNSMKSDQTRSLQHSKPILQALVRVWGNVRKQLRPWLAQQHQQGRAKYPDLAAEVQRRASVLLFLVPCTAPAPRPPPGGMSHTPLLQSHGSGSGQSFYSHPGRTAQGHNHKDKHPHQGTHTTQSSGSKIKVAADPKHGSHAQQKSATTAGEGAPTAASRIALPPFTPTISTASESAELNDAEEEFDEDEQWKRVLEVLDPVVRFVTMAGLPVRRGPSGYDIYRILEARGTAALQRALAVASTTTMFQHVQAESTRILLLWGANSVVKSPAFRSLLPPSLRGCEHHIATNLEGAASHPARTVRHAVRRMALQLLAQLPQPPSDSPANGRHHTANDDQEAWYVLASEILTMAFQPSDVHWILESQLWVALLPLVHRPGMYSAGSSTEASRPESSKKALQALRALSLSVVDMLDRWEDHYSLRVPRPARDSVRGELMRLRDQMFGQLVSEMEWIAGRLVGGASLAESASLVQPSLPTADTAALAVVLGELLEVLVAVLASPHARDCLGATRLQGLLVPLVQHRPAASAFGAAAARLPEIAFSVLSRVVLAASSQAPDDSLATSLPPTDESGTATARRPLCRATIAYLLEMLGAVEAEGLVPHAIYTPTPPAPAASTGVTLIGGLARGFGGSRNSNFAAMYAATSVSSSSSGSLSMSRSRERSESGPGLVAVAGIATGLEADVYAFFLALLSGQGASEWRSELQRAVDDAIATLPLIVSRLQDKLRPLVQLASAAANSSPSYAVEPTSPVGVTGGNAVATELPADALRALGALALIVGPGRQPQAGDQVEVWTGQIRKSVTSREDANAYPVKREHVPANLASVIAGSLSNKKHHEHHTHARDRSPSPTPYALPLGASGSLSARSVGSLSATDTETATATTTLATHGGAAVGGRSRSNSITMQRSRSVVVSLGGPSAALAPSAASFSARDYKDKEKLGSSSTRKPKRVVSSRAQSGAMQPSPSARDVPALDVLAPTIVTEPDEPNPASTENSPQMAEVQPQPQPAAAPKLRPRWSERTLGETPEFNGLATANVEFDSQGLPVAVNMPVKAGLNRVWYAARVIDVNRFRGRCRVHLVHSDKIEDVEYSRVRFRQEGQEWVCPSPEFPTDRHVQALANSSLLSDDSMAPPAGSSTSATAAAQQLGLSLLLTYLHSRCAKALLRTATAKPAATVLQLMHLKQPLLALAQQAQKPAPGGLAPPPHHGAPPLKLSCCTFGATGPAASGSGLQAYYTCSTCRMPDKPLCAYCARVCHHGHVLGACELSEVVCECGTGESRGTCRGKVFPTGHASDSGLAPGEGLSQPKEQLEASAAEWRRLLPLYWYLKAAPGSQPPNQSNSASSQQQFGPVSSPSRLGAPPGTPANAIASPQRDSLLSPRSPLGVSEAGDRRTVETRSMQALVMAGFGADNAATALELFDGDITLAAAVLDQQRNLQPADGVTLTARQRLCATLEDMGFSRPEALAALQRFAYDLDASIAFLVERQQNASEASPEKDGKEGKKHSKGTRSSGGAHRTVARGTSGGTASRLQTRPTAKSDPSKSPVREKEKDRPQAERDSLALALQERDEALSGYGLLGLEFADEQLSRVEIMAAAEAASDHSIVDDRRKVEGPLFDIRGVQSYAFAYVVPPPGTSNTTIARLAGSIGVVVASTRDDHMILKIIDNAPSEQLDQGSNTTQQQGTGATAISFSSGSSGTASTGSGGANQPLSPLSIALSDNGVRQAHAVQTVSVFKSHLSILPNHVAPPLGHLPHALRIALVDLAVHHTRQLVLWSLAQATPTGVVGACGPSGPGVLPLHPLGPSDVYRVLRCCLRPLLPHPRAAFLLPEVQISESDSQVVCDFIEAAKNATALVHVSNAIDRISIWQLLLDGALGDLERFIENKPEVRALGFTDDRNGRLQACVFPGAASIVLCASERASLPTAQDSLALYLDPQCTRVAFSLVGPLSSEQVQQKLSRFIVRGDRFFIVVRSPVGLPPSFTLFAAPVTVSHAALELASVHRPSPELAVLALSHLCCSNSQLKKLSHHTEKARCWDAMLRYLAVPFAPYKGQIALSAMRFYQAFYAPDAAYPVPLDHRPDLATLKQLRIEMERAQFRRLARVPPLQQQQNQSARSGPPNWGMAGAFYRIADLLAHVRRGLASDLCSAALGGTESSAARHWYRVPTNDENTGSVVACCACAQLAALRDPSVTPEYYEHAVGACQANFANDLHWLLELAPAGNTISNSALVPYHEGQWVAHPADWFEHVGWVDQLAIVRATVTAFALETKPGAIPAPERWLVHEAALETKGRLVRRESAHPYSVVNDGGEISVPGARTLFVAFDKQSRTHRCDRLVFSRVKAGDDELGSFGGDEIACRSLAVEGDTVYYQFRSAGAQHEGISCDRCHSAVFGIRFHCTVCDDFDLCENCVASEPEVHDQTHLLLKLRRPVDCLPAALPVLYPHRYTSTALYRSNVHVNVRCNGCSRYPIVGVRYWCENCADFNLCESCAQHEYRHHDRHHVLLRVVRPLPRTLPPNALPYGLLYDRDGDTYWGYLFTVSGSSDPRIPPEEGCVQIARELEQVLTGSGDGEYATEEHPRGRAQVVQRMSVQADGQLIRFAEGRAKRGWQSVDSTEAAVVCLDPDGAGAGAGPLLSDLPPRLLKHRLTLLTLLNRKVARVLGRCDAVDPADKCHESCCCRCCSLEGGEEDRGNTVAATPLPVMLRGIRELLFGSVKVNTLHECLAATDVDCRPIELRINRHKAQLVQLGGGPMTVARTQGGVVASLAPSSASGSVAVSVITLPSAVTLPPRSPVGTTAVQALGPAVRLQAMPVPGPDGRDMRLTSFHQAFEQLFGVDPVPLRRKKAAWKVTFLGEASDDYGGPFRESLTVMCAELQSEALDVLVPVPNAANEVGTNREKWTLNPANGNLRLYTFLGMLMGIALRSKTVIPLDLPSLFWKQLALQPLALSDVEAIDQLTVQSISTAKSVTTEEECEEIFGDLRIYESFEVRGVDGGVTILAGQYEKVPVTFGNRTLFVDLAQSFKANECRPQLLALRKGLEAVIPHQYLALFTWRELELMICGQPEVDVEVLRRHTIYEGYTATSPVIKDFWAVMEGFDTSQRSLFLKFVWGRSRLAVTEDCFTAPMKIQRLDKPEPDNYLPLSHTCFFSLELPSYSCKEVMAQRLLYAITHCQAIDTDFTTAALDSRDAGLV
eukprot:TRINITY_DN19103_c0_g1_i1.p1 TRINITY_DN19103_c0_g1~~TRINITY_DN19103_c0_g1_i1.p1  ORF type:complete len:4696 (+),score=503.71 TRINITY_DN19103_c0_g1_i1:1491-14090(+)